MRWGSRGDDDVDGTRAIIIHWQRYDEIVKGICWAERISRLDSGLPAAPISPSIYPADYDYFNCHLLFTRQHSSHHSYVPEGGEYVLMPLNGSHITYEGSIITCTYVGADEWAIKMQSCSSSIH